MTASNQPIELDEPKTESSSRRAVSLMLLGCAVMFGILNFGVTWLAMQIGMVFMVYAFLGSLLIGEKS